MCRPGSFFTLQIWAATPSYHSVRELQHFCPRPFLPLFPPLSSPLPSYSGLCFALLLVLLLLIYPILSLPGNSDILVIQHMYTFILIALVLHHQYDDEWWYGECG